MERKVTIKHADVAAKYGIPPNMIMEYAIVLNTNMQYVIKPCNI